MANDLLITLEEKINEAIETIELSRMEVTDLKEQNEELENRYADWETRLSTLIEKFEQLEDSEDAEVEEGMICFLCGETAEVRFGCAHVSCARCAFNHIRGCWGLFRGHERPLMPESKEDILSAA